MNIGSRSTSGNVGNVIIESGVIEIIGFAVSMESLSLIVQFLAPMDAGILFSKNSDFHFRFRPPYCHNADELNQIFYTRSYGRHSSRNTENRMHLSQRTWKISKIIAGGGLLEAPLGRASVNYCMTVAWTLPALLDSLKTFYPFPM